MELDELKKSWNALNEQLQKEPIADEQQITELIAGYTQLGEVVHFYVFGYIILACLDRLAAEASGTVCVLL